MNLDADSGGVFVLAHTEFRSSPLQKLSTTILARHENAPRQHNSNPFN
jgi:hypothetical protein